MAGKANMACRAARSRHAASCHPAMQPTQGAPASRRPILTGSGAGTLAATIGVNVKRLGASFDDLAVDDDLADAREAGQLEHRIEQDRLEHRARAARAG